MRRQAMSITSTALLLTAGCTSFAGTGSPPQPVPEPAATVRTSAPGEPLTLIADAEPIAAALSTSRALFERSEVVVLASAEDRAGTLLGASAAVGLGVPLLLHGEGVTQELDRLGTEAVLAVGDIDGAEPPVSQVVAVPADPESVATATGLELTDGDPVPEGGEPAAVAELEPEAPTALLTDDAEPPADRFDGEPLPEVEPAEPLRDTLVLTTGTPESVGALATARAAGARVLLTGGATDPRATAELVEALAAEDAESVVALGAGFTEEEGLDWKLATAATGAELPGGGQLLFPGRLLVALYGHPGTGALGVLGEQPLEAAIERAKAHAAPYEPLVDATVVPAFEIIATVASSSAGSDGNYSAEADPEFLRPWVEAAGDAGLYVLLDLQPGRTDFLTQAERYRSLLELPHVGLALDPEWRLGPGEVHLTQIGSVGVDEVNRVVTWLADLTRENALPQKLLVLHQFRLDMLPGREGVDTSRDELAVMIHADGQGGQGDKQATWRALHQNAPAGVYWGWKNFYDEDLPMLTPEQTVAQVDPMPSLISYQ